MKRLLFSIITLLTFLLFNYSQTFAQSNTSVGLRLGANIANLGGDAETDGARIGLGLGGFVTYSASETFGITGELLYSQKGARFDNQTSGETTQKLDYLDIPIYANYFLNKSGDFRPKLMVGPTFSFLLNSETEDDNGNTTEIDGLESFDFGALFGIGFHYKVGNGIWLNLDARYTLGLLSITGDNDNSVTNQNIAFMAGISFGL